MARPRFKDPPVKTESNGVTKLPNQISRNGMQLPRNLSRNAMKLVSEPSNIVPHKHCEVAKPLKQKVAQDSGPLANKQAENHIVPWAIKHSPRSFDEIALHPTKIQEIYTSLDPNSTTRVLVLSGPAGSSKSTAIQLTAQLRHQTIIEFHAPDAIVGSTTLINSFREFLVGAAMHDRRTTIVLVEELPSIFHEDTRQAFEQALIDWASEPDQPVVAVSFTEIEVSAKYNEAIVVARVLGRLVASPRHVIWLKTNPVNATLLMRMLKRVCEVESPGQSVPAGILKALAACGDVRSALNALELYFKAPKSVQGFVSGSVKGTLQSPVQGPVQGSVQGSVPGDLWVRGTPVELFYAIGKVVWTSSKQGSLEEALAMFDDTMETFCLTVLENYTSAKHKRLPISAAASVTEWLSIADMNGKEPGSVAGQRSSGSGSSVLSMSMLGALGAADAIAHSEARLDLPKRFVQTRFTQYPKWRSEHISEQARLQRTFRNTRQSQLTTEQAFVLDERAFESHFPKPSTPSLLEDQDDADDDDDDDF